MKEEPRRTMDKEGRAAQPVQDLRERTKEYALRIIRLYAALPQRGAGEVIGKQMLRSGTAVGRIIAKRTAPSRDRIL